MKYLHFKILTIVTVLFLFIVINPLYGGEASRILSLTKIEFDEHLKDNPDYEEPSYPYYYRKFYLRKEPEISFFNNDILFIKINKGLSYLKDRLVFTVTVYFTQSGRKKIGKYTEENVNNFIAIRYNNNILSVGTIGEKLDRWLRFGTVDKTATEINDLLSTLSTKIVDERDSLPKGWLGPKSRMKGN